MIYDKIRDIICEQFDMNPDEITRDSKFVADLGADSLDVVELTMSLEDEFHLPEIPEAELKAIVTVGDLVDYVEKNVKE